ncbi:MAG TPA: asparagine synthase-related protein, partial [Chloroflexia bacterium]|nr:asparagine synthase-related protein [Chloroflexia bacterium]
DALPAEVVWRRDKVGFETPEAEWLRAGQDHIMGLFAGDTGSEYLDLPAVRRALPSMLATPGHTAQLWRWINIVTWLHQFSRFRA